jgi:hypothetical protein
MAVLGEKEDDAILDAIFVHAIDMPILVRGYSLGRVEIDGPGWIDKQIKRTKEQGNYSPEA